MTNVTLAQVISRVESNDTPGAIRFEPTIYTRFTGLLTQAQRLALSTCQVSNKCSLATAQMICGSSWGRYQIMGENIYPRFQHTIADFLQFDLYQMQILKEFLGDWGYAEQPAAFQLTLAFAERYNGPGNPQAYLTELL